MTELLSMGSQQLISNAIAGFYKQRFGRGPTRVLTLISHDVVVCVVEDTVIPYERSLLETDGDAVVREGRSRVQRQIAEQAVGFIETIVGRHVRGHVPGYDCACDAATEVFLLDGVTGHDERIDVSQHHAPVA